MLRKKEIRLKLTLLIILLSISLGCVAKKPVRPQIPTRPVIEITKTPDGGIQLDKENSKKLALYIQELERAVRH